MATVVIAPTSFGRPARRTPEGARVPVEFRLRVADRFDAYRRAREGTSGAYLTTRGTVDESVTEREYQAVLNEAGALDGAFANRAQGVSE